MKIVAFSINPIFPDLITGGASKHLYHITRALGGAGHQLQILCARGRNQYAKFDWAKNVRVSPILPFHLPFPQPYAISGADLGLIIGRIGRALENADRFYIHDGEFLVPDVYEQIPTITSFRDNIYPESVLGTFLGKADEVICVSEYSAEVIKHTAALYYPGLNERIHLVNNGIDFGVFKPVETDKFAKSLGIDPQRHLVLLHPHRPEPGKGLPETIQLVDQLVNGHGLKQVRVLIPQWIDSMVSSEESAFYQEMSNLMHELRVWKHFIFIPWMAQEQMPAFYSLGHATLCLGNFVETFGNVAYESMACGTPSIVAKVGVHRTLMPDDLIDKVNFGDIEAAVERVLSIYHHKRRTEADAIAFLQTNMDFQTQVSSYSEIIASCEKRPQLKFVLPQQDKQQLYSLAPWCYIDSQQIYHDYRSRFEEDKQLTNLLQKTSRLSKLYAFEQGISEEQWDKWIDKTWLVPVKENLRK